MKRFDSHNYCLRLFFFKKTIIFTLLFQCVQKISTKFDKQSYFARSGQRYYYFN